MIRLQPDRTSSPWSATYRIRLFIWAIVWTSFCRWTPKPFNSFRLSILRLFGARISNTAFVHQRAIIAHPWNLTMGPGSCIGDSAQIYNLAHVDLGSGATVAQESYLCTASHDFGSPSLSLIASAIVIEQDAFIGARAFILPGVIVGRSAIVGACSVVTRSVSPAQTVAGNPARPLSSST